MKDRATQLLIKYKSGALVTQCNVDEILDEKTWESWTGGGQGSYLSRSMCAAVHCAHCAFVCIVTIVSLERQ